MKLDEFESVFRSAVKQRFAYQPPSINRVLLITDLASTETDKLLEQVRSFLRVVDPFGKVEYSAVGEGDYSGVHGMLEQVEQARADLIVAYRNLYSHRDLPFTLGSYLDTLTQATTTPVLVLPPPSRPDFAQRLAGTERVMVVTDHLTGDDRLVNWGVHFCAKAGTLHLVHVEDDETLTRYIDVIARLPDVDTDAARREIREKLLRMPTDYIATIAQALTQENLQEHIEAHVVLGHALTDYKRLVSDHAVDLLVLNTKDDRQLAMHGMAYALTVELRERPMLLL